MKRNGEPTVAYLGGTFDLFHRGHIELLKHAFNNFDKVVVGLNKSEFVSRFKRAPVQNYQDRKAALEACRYVHEVIENSGDEDSRPALLACGATHFVHGNDWTGDALMHQLGVTNEWLEEHDIKIVYFPYTPGISTSAIIEKIRVGEGWLSIRGTAS